MPTVGVGLSLRIHGAKESQAAIKLYRATVPERINEALADEIDEAEERIRQAVQAQYTTGEGSGRTARGLELELRPGKRGASVRLRMAVSTYSKFLTTLLPGSNFQEKSYYIFHKNSNWLRFFWKAGPRGPGIYYAKKVLHPGFGKDVIREQAELELQRLGQIVQMEVANVTTEVFAATPGGPRR